MSFSLKKKNTFSSSFYSRLFSKTKNQLKDIFSSYRKDNIKKIESLIREQYIRERMFREQAPLDGRDVVTFLVNKNYTE